MCGVLGIVGSSAVGHRLYDGLTLLQHRGQDAAGIATSCDGKFIMRKGAGLVRDVFSADNMANLRGDMGIAHTRYPTAAQSSNANCLSLIFGTSTHGLIQKSY